MTQKENLTSPKAKKETSTIAFYVSSAIVAILAVAYLVNNIVLFKSIVDQYVLQGYPKADVMKQLIQSQLIPETIQPIAIMGGIAVLLFAAGKINKKVSNCLSLLAKNEAVETVEAEASEAVESDQPKNEPEA